METEMGEIVDLNRILRLRKALARGTYVIDSQKIARAMLSDSQDNPLRLGAASRRDRR
jgi:anti-sigma28 factor (negative regulator of flagellin synthesis)